MLKSVALAHFKKVSAVAAALDISVQAVSQWGPLIPENAAYKLESITKRKLRVNPADYANITARQAKLASQAETA